MLGDVVTKTITLHQWFEIIGKLRKKSEQCYNTWLKQIHMSMGETDSSSTNTHILQRQTLYRTDEQFTWYISLYKFLLHPCTKVINERNCNSWKLCKHYLILIIYKIFNVWYPNLHVFYISTMYETI